MIPLGTGDPLRIGPYRLLGVLGEGGMGRVYLGRENAGRRAAVKVLRRELAHDQNLAQRFVREARTAQSVNSAGVARVLGAHTEGGRPWIATEFLVGPTLEEAVAAYGPLDEPGVRALASALARTLRDIHAVGLIHRDLKPSNIVLTSGGPRIIDFGIARPEHGLTLTHTGQVPVTPGYGAPEQVLGQRVGPAADVFSLGAVLAFAASGRRAYDGPHVAGVQYQVVHGEPDVSRVPAELRPLLLPCLAKKAAERPQPVQIARVLAAPRGADKLWRKGPLAADIARRENTAASVTATFATDTPTPPSRRRVLAALAGGGAVLATGGGAGAVWWLRKDSGTPNSASVPPPAERTDAQPLGPGEALDVLWEASTGVDNQNPALLPVRDVVVFGAAGGGLAARRVTDGKPKWTAPDVGAAAGFVNVADRLIVAVDGEGRLHAFIASTGQRAWTVSASVENLLAADARAIYVMTRQRQLCAVSVGTRRKLWSVPTPVRTSTGQPAAAVVGRGRLVLVPSDGHVKVVDTTTGRTAWEIPDQGARAVLPAVEGGTVYFGGRTLTARSLTSGNELWSVPPQYEAWGPPTVRGGEVYAISGDFFRYGARDGKQVWSVDSSSRVVASTRPAVQGSTVWFAESNNSRLFGVRTRTGESVSRYEHDGDYRTYSTAGDGNRVFVTQGGVIAALPVHK
ncbi:PQQ-binding-like beta-propeller repeat protein [Streptomyces sp. NPDC058572]|uniref:protein kinase domain-containing protein n=1 Tax=Streptomyces sp. NPDC058572 TaxID=3346546 RepID=UPI00365224D7